MRRSHMRHLIEDGFEVAVVKEATTAAQHPDLDDGYYAALIKDLSPAQFARPMSRWRP